MGRWLMSQWQFKTLEVGRCVQGHMTALLLILVFFQGQVQRVVLGSPTVTLHHVITTLVIHGVVLVTHDGTLTVFQVLWYFLYLHQQTVSMK